MNIPKHLLWFIFLPFFCSGQQVLSDRNPPVTDFKTILFLESGVGFSAYTGQGHLARAYDSNPVGWHIMGQFNAEGSWLLGFYYDENFLKVADRQIVGAYDTSRVFHYQGVAGYRWLETGTFSLESSLGVGFTRIRNKVEAQDTRFLDKGWGIGFYGRFSWAFSQNFGLFAGVNVNWDSYSTAVSPDLSDVFNDSFRVMPLFGLRFLARKGG